MPSETRNHLSFRTIRWFFLQRVLSYNKNKEGTLHDATRSTVVGWHRSLSECRGLRVLPALNGSRRLRSLRADRAALHHVSPDLCRHSPRLRELWVPTLSYDTGNYHYLEQISKDQRAWSHNNRCSVRNATDASETNYVPRRSSLL